MMHNIWHSFNTLVYAGIALLAVLIFLGMGAVWWTSRGPDMSQPWTPPVHSVHGAVIPPITYILEEALLDTDVVARVRLLGVEEEIRSPGENEAYGAYMEFKFEVLEYLKGGYGLNPIWGYVALEQAEGSTEEEARWKSKYFWARRNSQWDDKEAIVLMWDTDKQNRKDHFGLGRFSPYSGESYRLTGMGRKKWLPAASVSGVSGASNEQTFLLEYPRSGIAGASSNNGDLVSLSELRQLAALSNAELARRVRSLSWFGRITESTKDLPPATGIYHLAAITRLDTVELSWDRTDDAANVLGHRILRRKQSDSQFIELTDVRVDGETFYEDTRDIQPETKYIYRLRAYGKDGDIADARIAITTGPALEPLGAPTATPPAVPTATPTLAPAATATQTPTATATATLEPTPTHTPEPTSTATYEPPPPGGVIGQGEDAPTPTPTPTATSAPEATPTYTPTPTP